MLNPLKAPTSFECDGCGHHASFHKMDNRQDEESVRSWKENQMVSDSLRSLAFGNKGRLNAPPRVQALVRQEIDNRATEDSDDGLQAIEDVTEVTRPALKRRRVAGR